jgi:ATP-dependent DNA helicase RecQ
METSKPEMPEDRERADSDPVGEEARARFGIQYLYPWQRLVIANVLDAVAASEAARAKEREKGQGDTEDDERDEDGSDRGRQIVILPTGAGKSLCFQVPSLFFGAPTLVVFPLVALMADQERRLTVCGIEPAVFRGGQSADERNRAYARLEGGDGKPAAKVVIANPEILASEEILERLSRRGVAHLAIDEAHCVSEWGDTFRPAYLTLPRVIERLKPLAVTAFTATASPAVLSRTAEALFGEQVRVVRGESDRPNIAYTVRLCRAKDPALVREVTRRKRPLVVFCATRGGTERTANFLRDTFDDGEIRFYHAGLSREEKTAVEAWFHGHANAILTATCAWGLGIDKKNVRTVIHKDPPPSVEAYVQEAGRGGRDGQPAEAVLLWGPKDRKRLQALAGTQGARAAGIIRFAEGSGCRRESLLETLGDWRAGADAPEGERIACSGCDRCSETADDECGDGAIVLEYIRRNARSCSRETIAERLTTQGNREARDTGNYPAWKRADFIGIIGELEKEGLVRERDHRPWKGTMTVTRPSPRPRRSLPSPASRLFSSRAWRVSPLSPPRLQESRKPEPD